MHRRGFLRSLAAAPAAGLVHVPFALPWKAIAQRRGGMAQAEPFKPTEEANYPIGAGKGIYPGRVVWVRDASATSWDGVTGHWWDDAYTNQKAVHAMMSDLLRNLTGKKNQRQAWEALFASSGGYSHGERIAIKVNCKDGRAYLNIKLCVGNSSGSWSDRVAAPVTPKSRNRWGTPTRSRPPDCRASADVDRRRVRSCRYTRAQERQAEDERCRSESDCRGATKTMGSD